jgi:hypothetical protein
LYIARLPLCSPAANARPPKLRWGAHLGREVLTDRDAGRDGGGIFRGAKRAGLDAGQPTRSGSVPAAVLLYCPGDVRRPGGISSWLPRNELQGKRNACGAGQTNDK